MVPTVRFRHRPLGRFSARTLVQSPTSHFPTATPKDASQAINNTPYHPLRRPQYAFDKVIFFCLALYSTTELLTRLHEATGQVSLRVQQPRVRDHHQKDTIKRVLFACRSPRDRDATNSDHCERPRTASPTYQHCRGLGLSAQEDTRGSRHAKRHPPSRGGNLASSPK